MNENIGDFTVLRPKLRALYHHIDTLVKTEIISVYTGEQLELMVEDAWEEGFENGWTAGRNEQEKDNNEI